MALLAIKGGSPVRTKPFTAYNVIGNEEKTAVNRVLDSGILSKFLGSWGKYFNGGPEILAMEKEWAAHFGVKHAIAVNSCTSGLYCAVGAVGIEPLDEVIVSPYTMAASATAPIVFNAIPVFADVEPENFCLDPKSVEARITPRTKAIIVVDIFGQPYDADAINKIAKKHGIKVIEDCAQAPGALYKGKFAGTLADVGVYSLNYHKHIHTGEGGVVVTDNDEIADKVRLIRNHAEAVVGPMGFKDVANMIGFNFRMTEIEAAIARCQLAKLDKLVKSRQENCEYIAKRIAEIPAFKPCGPRSGASHVYYVQPLLFDETAAGVHRNVFIDAVRAELPETELRAGEGPRLTYGYVKPLYLQPMFQQQLAFGHSGWPFHSKDHKLPTNYAPGLCPVTERLHEKELVTHELMHSFMTKTELDDVLAAFHKVWENRAQLKK